MLGLLFWLFCALVTGTLMSHLVGLGHKGTKWHLGIGVVGLLLNWAFMLFLPLPHFVRVTVNGSSVYLVCGPVFVLIVAIVVAVVQPERNEEAGRTDWV